MSLENLAEAISVTTGEEISKQAVDQRFTQEAVDFFKKLVESALQELCAEEYCYDFLRQFKEVRIKDSTCFQLPSSMSEKYPGSGGSSTAASIRIQFEFDIKSGKILDLSLFPLTRQDMTNAEETLGEIIDNVLIIRDLGYCSVKAIHEINEKGAYYISRLINGAVVYRLKDNKYRKIDFRAVLRYLKRYNLKSMEMDVYVTKQKEPARMIIEQMPEEVVRQRLNKSGQQANKQGNAMSEAWKAKAHLNIFITNVPSNMLNNEQVHKIYTIRWQVELVFKVWKSIGDIHKVKKMKILRFECCLYAKLLWIIINWNIVWQFNRLLYASSGKLISFYKAFKSLKANITIFQISLEAGRNALQDFIERQFKKAERHNLLDKKKNKNTMYELIQIM